MKQISLRLQMKQISLRLQMKQMQGEEAEGRTNAEEWAQPHTF